MGDERRHRASPIERDLRALLPPALGLFASSALALLYVVGLGDAFWAVAGLVATAWVCVAAVAHQRARLRRLAPREVRVEGDALFVGARRIDRAAITHGVVVDTQDGAVVQLRTTRWRQPLVLHFDDPSSARDLLAALKLGADQTTATFLAQSPWLAERWFSDGLIGALVAVCALAVAVVPLGWPPIIGVVALALLVPPIVLAALPSFFSVGLDGLGFTTLGRREFFPWSRVLSVRAFGERSLLGRAGGVEITVDGRGAPLRIPMGTDTLTGDTPERLAARIEQARDAAVGSRAPALELSGSLEDRVRVAKGVLEGAGGYRVGHVEPDAVGDLLADPAAAAEDRVAAALALVDHPGGRARVRVAAETTADRSVRAALEAAASEDAAVALHAAIRRRRRV